MVCAACTDRAACRKAKDCAAQPQRIVVPASRRVGLRAFAGAVGFDLRPWQEQFLDVVDRSPPCRLIVHRPYRFGRRWLENAMRKAAAGIPRMFDDAVIAAVHARHMALVQAAIPSDPQPETGRSSQDGDRA